MAEAEKKEPAKNKTSGSILKWIVILLVLLLAVLIGFWTVRESLREGKLTVPNVSDVVKTIEEGVTAVTGGGSGAVPGGTGAEPGSSGGPAPGSSGGGAGLGQAGAGAGTPQIMRNGTLMVPVDQGAQVRGPLLAQSNATSLQANATQDAPPVAGEDSVVRLAAVKDLAEFLVDNYWPKGAHPGAKSSGISTLSLKALNLRYGVNLRGLSWAGEDPSRGRAYVLSYIFTPSMIDGLERLYSDRLIEYMLEAGRRARRGADARTGLSNAELAEMFNIYAGMAKEVADGAQAYAENPEAGKRLEAYFAAEQAAYAANTRYVELMSALGGQDDEKPVEAGSAARQAELDAAGKEYQTSIPQREKARESAIAAMSRGAAKRSSPDSLLYLSAWCSRRGPAGLPALKSAVKAVNNLAAKMNKAAVDLR